ncbi:MAG TPA: Trk system potassium transporter TrkA [Tenuifilaceae bacterium]|nr:Trk system potassium transporter TrkA [Tenuifilaceae bacterium]HPE19448.1 Trk system potassium transporter TrkA [Tenuifilaceae bacterium]HPJ46050.1 Trk system potassium transporter TrkA [Tenuifilaceae bacterium]HPQ34252.1 Trk system potassium transporter TrkA [Tenuifilaceae bacterium]HRX69286.1 Trk system potassium transporter TrkA [Tenuifilaceae bacterium]
MNIIIAGAGDVGTHLAKMLANEYHDIIVIDPDAEKLQQLASNSDLLVVEGSSTSISALKDANVKKADLFIAVAHSEETNIISATLAKRLGAKKVIARIDNNDYLLPNNKEIFLNLGIDSLIYPEKLAAKEVIGLLGQTSSTEYVDFSGGKLSLVVFRLDRDAPVIDQTILEATKSNKSLDYRAVAIAREGETIIPRGNDQFKVNDLVYVISNQSAIKEMLEYSGKQNVEVHNLMVLGGSRVGIRIAMELEKNVNVKIIEQDKDKSTRLANFFKNALVINGDGRDTDLLMQEGLQYMDAFVAVTGNSETNILTCIVAKRMGVKKTIAEIENIDYIQLAESMGIDTVINKKLITASRIFRYTMSTEVSAIKCLTGSEAEVLEFIVKPNSPVTKGKLKDIHFPKDAIIGGVVRGDASYIAKGDTEIKAYDRVVVFALPSAINKVGKFFN